MNQLFHLGLCNALLAGVLCLLAFVLDRRFRQPRVTHTILLFALVKLLTPPLVRIPVDLSEIRQVATPTADVSSSVSGPGGTERLALPAFAASETRPSAVAASPAESRVTWADLQTGLIVVWCVGTLLMLLTALVRVVRFHRLLRQTTKAAPAEFTHAADCVAWQMGMRRAPQVLVTSAGLSPFVWWAGRQVLVIVPVQLVTSLSESRRDLLLAHEFAHVRRRDYLVRWLECGARALFWWNPMVWWAQKQLRISEEACCDEMVIRQMSVTSLEYASTLVDALETLVRPAIRPPAIVSAINSGGVLERRIQMILNGGTRPFSRSLYGLV
ncbi:MAG: M56 family metallopeptidase, partial [Planctomycetaceae bacterium]|nr:M56 family metallopeptidase [Planctomycetaceae bacterium]